MKVLVPFSELDPATADFAAVVGADPTYVGWCDEAYWGVLRDAFAARASFVIVEHDVVPTIDQYVELVNCAGDWCAFPYRVHQTQAVASLGFTKFGAALIARHPDWITAIPEGSRHWSGLDGPVVTGLERAGERLHVHPGEVVHHHRESVAHPNWRPALTTHLKYIGGGRYVHEDVPAGIPALPTADFETDDPRTVALAIESGLYEEAKPVVAEAKAAEEPAKAEAPREVARSRDV